MLYKTPETAFEIQGDSIVFAEPPQPPASVKYVNVHYSKFLLKITFNNIGGIFPTAGMTLVGTASAARLTVTSVVGNDIFGFITQGTYLLLGELVTVGATGFAANMDEWCHTYFKYWSIYLR